MPGYDVWAHILPCSVHRDSCCVFVYIFRVFVWMQVYHCLWMFAVHAHFSCLRNMPMAMACPHALVVTHCLLWAWKRLNVGLYCLVRVEICHNRRDRRLCKICAICVNFSRKQSAFLQNLRRSTGFTFNKCDFTLKLLKFHAHLVCKVSGKSHVCAWSLNFANYLDFIFFFCLENGNPACIQVLNITELVFMKLNF